MPTDLEDGEKCPVGQEPNSVIENLVNLSKIKSITPPKVLKTMIKIKSNSARSAFRTIGVHDVFFNDEGIGYLDDCYHQDLSDHMDRVPNQFSRVMPSAVEEAVAVAAMDGVLQDRAAVEKLALDTIPVENLRLDAEEKVADDTFVDGEFGGEDTVDESEPTNAHADSAFQEFSENSDEEESEPADDMDKILEDIRSGKKKPMGRPRKKK